MKKEEAVEGIDIDARVAGGGGGDSAVVDGEKRYYYYLEVVEWGDDDVNSSLPSRWCSNPSMGGLARRS